jgi:adenosylmethionine-8-amino-7-oxononanoate aminotransferase
VSPCFPYHYQKPQEPTDAYVLRLANELEAEFQRIGPERVAAFCLEPVVGATTGCVVAAEGYLKAVREVCDRHGALLIFDEVMCGMGRTGFQHAWQFDSVAPDLQAIAKGLGGGFQPIGAVLVGNRVFDAVARGTGTLRTGHTYQSHPIACAAALEVQLIIRDEGLLQNVRSMGEHLGQELRSHFSHNPHVGDIRGRGLFWAIELVANSATRTPFSAKQRVSDRIQSAALRRGLAVYCGAGTFDGVLGDHVIIAPPFNVQRRDIDRIVARLADAIVSLQPVLEAAAMDDSTSASGSSIALGSVGVAHRDGS